MREIRIENPVLNSYLADLAADYSSGTSITVRSNNSFQANDLAVFGKQGEELSEAKKINSLSGSTDFVLASTLNFQHNKGTPVFKTIWDFVSIEGRSSSTESFAVITSSSIQWDNKNNKTIYFHSTGDDLWQYRFRFYNSVTSQYSEYSPTLGGSGFTKYQLGYLIKDARRIAGDKDGKILTTDELLRSATRAKNIVRAHNPRFWFWKVDGYKNNKSILATAGNNTYDLAAINGLGTVNYIEYAYSQGNTSEKYILRSKPDAEFLSETRDLNRPNLDYPRLFRLLPPDDNSIKGYFEIENKILNSGVGIFYVSFYKEEADYTSVEDSTSIIMPEILEDYLIAEIYRTKGNQDKADEYYKLFAGPEQRKKTLALEDLTGIALLDELDKQYKHTQSQPQSIWKFRGQKAVSRMFGSRMRASSDQIRENYFDGANSA